MLRGRGRIIGVNDAGLHLAPWCDILYWSDKRWLEWNADDLFLHSGPLKVTRRAPHIETGFEIKVLGHMPGTFSNDPRYLGGICSGSCALNLAVLLGARKIVLLGFDMKDGVGNYHNNHLMPPGKNQYKSRFLPAIEKMAPQIANLGVKVFNATPDSALLCFPKISLEEYLTQVR